jgi:hypothetical protein
MQAGRQCSAGGGDHYHMLTVVLAGGAWGVGCGVQDGGVRDGGRTMVSLVFAVDWNGAVMGRDIGCEGVLFEGGTCQRTAHWRWCTSYLGVKQLFLLVHVYVIKVILFVRFLCASRVNA